ncbi:bifunctional tRNA (5-methylaminomethyl-2-thiouridine)(34)-methyltransferase MnmD/FAD-dependent 5-carboxymethylaminomethyl-2-thiouridine(34) oxidoreductase MnmC [Psychrobium sp. 1_MG-2023]|uniref:bifunctional tRNA (5-methylaminomethyl-2-thiouridine)(34)-methyltransferase MnmD/FAD-dependent 5-carboxymethylaminomethyl-2-thiouridine(34) oxidoreductase MnmC n=1 Tax=Psychrobium sp. 1_MG-2023 TaxID=3062624 RepID=UPI000C339F67|nr:bifunctional tRNA (5-methylaminomethyl-2-thiouridine)(34)-methyltransferase MnmD/FAD-dependent 5-carboxymethylaminomethyl-2-thiouridine(34) oxidoreductase MnmC [Psychrobium sp. 1_MG-2023]MDP2561756.1 bifunctional tRNA (5-methylaminomethyl-2-thiouridine)(34)-methyltransferase MnmD/FAD-dependent 5-carboxymethylaminomethyl-2-thiouridine(34) oxidoreductase MnmC [Psychrobium sp. 1_MG-2023]PKF59757.1 bifunctional tRNA (5-methylaminomethyl-2-thiouridine)(34)-methyltransferase MnmD/FAD-dependent 5-car
MSQPIEYAQLSWNDQGEPSSTLFDDLYFSTTDGLAETQYVFIEQNNLQQRWLNCQDSHYVIAETGFGSGLNFLATWLAFEKFRQQHPLHILKRLFFISFEKYPLSKQDLNSAHQRWPQLARYTKQLQQHYPIAVAGCHRQRFSLSQDLTNSCTDAVILDLWFGDIKDTLPQLSYPRQGLVDSWFLDGFAPSKNPDMWSQQLFDNMARVTKDLGSLATFTAAGFVRRGLIEAGFVMTKAKGFGKKREMLCGLFKRTTQSSSTQHWYHRPTSTIPLYNQPKIHIIGGGIASAMQALSLAERGVSSTIICKDEHLAAGASGNKQGGFYPLINANHDPLSQFYSQSFLFAQQIYRPLCQSFQQAGRFCGVLQVATTDKEKKRQHRLLKTEQFPESLVHGVVAEQASKIASVNITDSGLFYPEGGWLNPRFLTQALVEKAQKLATVDVVFEHQLLKIEQQDQQWQLSLIDKNNEQRTIASDIVILANGHHLTDFEQTNQLPLYATAGQVSHIKQTPLTQALNTVLCYQGYMTPAFNGEHCIGASFNRDVSNHQINPHEHQQNIDKLVGDFNGQSWSQSIKGAPLAGKSGVRMSVKDHLPMVGTIPQAQLTQSLYNDLDRGRPSHQYPLAPHYPNLFMLGGLGSRGLCSSPLLAEILTSQLCHEPLPLSQRLVDQLNPNRYWIKQLKQGKSLMGEESR